MKRFYYWRDSLCVGSTFCYTLNRFVLKAATHSRFLHGYFNDLFLIPAALPWVLWLHRRLGWRADDLPPRAGEIGFHLLVWALVCEGFGPALTGRGTADPWDVAAYAAGALAAGLWWSRHRFGASPA